MMKRSALLLAMLLFAAAWITPVAAETLLSDDFDNTDGDLAGRKARTGQEWMTQKAAWNSGTLVAGTEFGQRRSAGVGFRDDSGRKWKGNIIGLGKELQHGTVVFGVDIRQGIGIIESCAALESADGVEGVTLIWSGQRLKCGGNTWTGEIDMGVAEGNVRVELILHLERDSPGNSTATMRYLDIDNPSNHGSVDLGRPRSPDRNGSGSFEFSQVALHVLKSGDARFGFDNVSVRDNVLGIPELKPVPVPAKRLLLDSRFVASTDNAALRVGHVTKNPANPLFGEEYEWESRFDNLYPNVIYDEQEKLLKVWYFTWTYDPATTDVPRDQRKPGTYMKVREASGKGLKEGLGYATSKDGLRWEKPLMRVSPWGNKPSNLVAQPCHGAGILKDLRERDPARRYKMFLKGQGMAARFSPDGIHWGQYVPLPEIDAAGDTHNNALWCPELKKYVGFTRLWRDGMRVVGRTESPDFVYWTRAVEVLSDKREAQPYSMPVIRDNEIHIYYGGCNAQHFDWRDGFLCLATLRPDGFAGYQPRDPDKPAALTTKPIEVAGDLRISADTQSGGSIDVSVLDERGEVVLQSETLMGAVTDHKVEWRDGGSLEKWIGKSVRLRFTIERATLYAFEV